MPFNPNQYQQKIVRGRQLIMQRSLSELEINIIEAWQQEMRRIVQKLSGNQISVDAADRLRREILAAVQRWTSSVDGVVKDSSVRTIDRVRQLHQELLKRIEADNSVSLSYSFDGFNADALEGMFVRRGIDVVNSFKTLQNSRVADVITEPLGQALSEGVRSGNWQTTTRNIARLLSIGELDDLDQLREIARRQGISLTEVALARMAEPDLDGSTADAIRSQMFNARRIAQTEIDVAAHEGERVAAVRNPIIKGVQWKTSTRHRTLDSAPDVCDVLEQYDFHGIGDGVYYPNTLPAKPHPFDGCTRLYVMREHQQWDEKKAKPTRPAMIETAQVMQIMSSVATSNSRRLTPKFISYTTNQANQYVQLAWQAYSQRQRQVA